VGVLEDAAAAAGPVRPGHFRVAVLEADGRATTRDFATLAEARVYATDAASEVEALPPVARIFRAELRAVEDGRHYARASG
jgi:hypothetical protein